jgi:hypothetical protein
MKRLVSLAVFATWAVAIASLAVCSNRSEADPTWTMMDGPTDGFSDCILKGAAVVSPEELWAVGMYQTSSGQNWPLILRYQGSSWSVMPTSESVPSCTDGNILWGGNGLSAASVVSATNAWAVGSGCYGYETLIMHWNGSAWSRVPSPNPVSDGQNALIGVVAVAANDVWAVGYTFDGARSGALIEHWDGAQWSALASPVVGAQLSAVTAVSARELWAVGSRYNEAEERTETLVLRADDGRWRVIPSPNPGTYSNLLQSVAAVGPNDVWAVGTSSAGGCTRTLVEHWDGHVWSVVPSPNVDTQASASNRLRSIAALSANNLWAVGMYENENTDVHQHRSLLMHWDGSSWSLASLPSPGRSADPTAIVAGPYQEGLTVGLYSDSPIDIYDGHYTAAQPLMLEASLGQVLAVEPSVSAQATLRVVSRNPALGRARVALHLPRRAAVTLGIVDVRGRRVRSLLSESLGAGDHVIDWDGADSRGMPCAPGLYFVTLETGGRAPETRTVTLLR